jgi:Flp pilus assembly protein TadD
MQRYFTLTILVMFSISGVFADEISEGYKAFIANDINNAYAHFTAATQDPNEKAEACLMLSLLASVDKDQSVSFGYFRDFCASAPNADPYIYALMHHSGVLGYSSLQSKEQLDWLLGLLKKPNLNASLKAHVNETLAKYYEYTYDQKSSKDYFSRIGAVMDWQIAGDFENISASGFDKNYPPIVHPEPDAVFKNKVNADVKWFDLYKLTPGKWIDFTANFYINSTMVFAQTFCNSPSEQTVYLRVGTSGSLKIWINDQLLFQEPEERNNGIDTYIIPVKMFQGNNRILLQIGSSKIDQCNFMLRATDKDGNPLSNLSFSGTYKPYNKTVQEIPVPVTSFAEEYLLKQLEENPEKLLNYLVLANAYLMNDKVHDALDILQKAQKMAPDCSFILEQLIELYTRDQDRTLTSLTEERLKQVDPDNPRTLNYQINSAFEAKNYTDVRKYLEKKEKLYGENDDVLYYKRHLASEENNAEEYTALLNKSYLKHPEDYNIVYDKYQFEKGYKQDSKEGIRILKDFTKKYCHASALNLLSDEYFQAGQASNGIEILKKLIEFFPSSDGYYKNLGMYYLQAGNYSAARQYLSQAILIAPYYGPYHGNFARVLEETGETDQAITEYKADIAYRPDDYDAISKLRKLQSKKEAFEYFPVKDYYKIFQDSPSAADYPNDNILSLAEDRQVVLYKDGGCELRQVLLYKALTLKGIDYLKEYSVGYLANEQLTIEKAEVLKKNGNRLQAEVNDNQAVFTSLEPGDAILLIYKKSRTISGMMSKQFYEKWLLNSWYPSLNIEYNLLAEKGVKFDFKVDHAQVDPVVTDADDFSLYTWRKTMNKAIASESYMPAMIDIGIVLNISTLPSWDYVSKWYYDISQTKTKPDKEVTETVNALLKGKENMTELQKAGIIYDFIERTIRYSSVAFRQSGLVPQEASDVLTTRIGDCKDMAVLFTSMCKVAGIKANVELLIRRKSGVNWTTLPSFDFDHAIAKASLDGKDYYIELTSNYFPFAAMGDSHIGAVALDVNNDTTVKVKPCLLNPTTRKANNVSRESTVTFNGDNMTSTIVAWRTGYLAAGIRSDYRDQGADDRQKDFAKSLTGDYPNVKLLSLNFDSSLYTCSDTVTYNYSFTTPRVFTKINNLSILKLPLANKWDPVQFLSLEERKYPIELWAYNISDTVMEKLTIKIPENKVLAEVPKTVHFSCNQADYTMSFNLVGKELHVVRTMISKMKTVPVADYKEYRSFMESVVNSDNQQIGFN